MTLFQVGHRLSPCPAPRVRGDDLITAYLWREIDRVTNSCALSSDLREVSPEYYNTLDNECWGIAEIMRIDGVAASVSSERTVERTAQKQQATKRSRRWSRAEKRAYQQQLEAKHELALVA